MTTETWKEAIARQHRSCENCKHCVLQDEGYSNYTVEGTTVDCAVKAHPDVPFDRWYGEDGRLRYAIWCDKFDEGLHLEFDVDDDWIMYVATPKDDEGADWLRRAVVYKFGTPEGFEAALKYLGPVHAEKIRRTVKAVW